MEMGAVVRRQMPLLRRCGVMAETKYIARFYGKRGKPAIGAAHETREGAAAELLAAYPKAKQISTSRAALIDGAWSDAGGLDIRWHDRENSK